MNKTIAKAIAENAKQNGMSTSYIYEQIQQTIDLGFEDPLSKLHWETIP